MKRMGQQNLMAAMATSAVLAMHTMTAVAQPDATKAQVSDNTPKRVIVVSLEDRKLALMEDGKVKKIYSVAVGKPSTPSPVGTFSIERRVMNPTYSHDGRVVPPGPGNPVGTRWMGLSIRGYGIHGTNAPSSIGKAASHGCIRMDKADLEELFAQVQVGDTVELIGTRNEETAELFGDGPKPAPVITQQPVVMAAAQTAPATTADSGSIQTSSIQTTSILANFILNGSM
jgi:murein L,D-transpeptidase YcbB/YkuD